MINLTPHALLFTISAIGVSETAYLIKKRIASERPVCPIGQGCETVLNSKYNRLFFGIHNDMAGLAFYILLAGISALVVIGTNYTQILIGLANFASITASLMSIIFTYLQGKVIQAWCFWCLMSALTVALIDIILLTAKLT